MLPFLSPMTCLRPSLRADRSIAVKPTVMAMSVLLSVAIWTPLLVAAQSVAGALGSVGGVTMDRAVRQQPNGDILVLAASSLTDVLPTIAAVWTQKTQTTVHFSFDATSRLAPQAASGVPADVFVSADEHWIRWLESEGLVDGAYSIPIIENELVLIVPSGDPSLRGPAELTRIGRLALAGENVPAGRYARQALRAAGVWTALEERVIVGGSVRGVLEWVARGEVPAGVVYRTDAIREPDVAVAFSFDGTLHSPVRYWASALEGASSPTVAADFVSYLGTEEALEVFRSAGFRRVGSQSALVPAERPSSPLGLGSQDATREISTASLPSIGSAVRLSLVVALFATVVGLVPAVGLGWLLARRDFRGKSLVSTIVLAPLVIPPVVTGFLLLTLLGSRSPLGSLFASLGLPVPFTLFGATVAAFIVGMPLYVLAVRGAFEAVDPLYEELSWTLGVTPRDTFRRVSLPLAIPGIAAGAMLAFARALGEFGATVVLAGNVEGSTRTIALAVYTLLESPSGKGAIWALVGCSIGLSLLALFGYETLSRRQRQQRLEDDHGR